MLKIRGIIITVVLLLIGQCFLLGQNKQFESYEKDTSKVNRYVDICRKIVFIYPDSTQKYVDTILNISEKINFDYGLFKGNNLQGLIYWISNDLDNALVQFKKTLKYTNSEVNLRDRAVVLSNIGLVYSHSYNSDSAIYYLNKTIDYSKRNSINDIYSKALFDISNLYLNQDNYVKTAESLFEVRNLVQNNNDSVLSLYVYSSFGILYSKLNKFDLALLNFQKALELDEKIEKVNSLSSIYIHIGELFLRTTELTDSAIYYYNEAVFNALPHNKQAVLMAANLNKGNVFMEDMNLDSANYYYQVIIKDTLIEKFPNRKAAVLVNLGTYYLKNKEYDLARRYLVLGHSLSDSLGIAIYVKNALQSLVTLDSILGNYHSSLKYFHSFNSVSDSISEDEANVNIAVLEFDKYMAKKSFENELLIKENTFKTKLISNQRILILLSLLSSVVLLILLYALYRNRRKIKLLLKKLSKKHNDSLLINEELNTTNEMLKFNQMELRDLNKTKDKFFSILGHDLKSPFNSLIGFLSLFNKQWDLLDDVKKKEMMQILYSNTMKTYDLLDNLLKWGKVQQGLLKCQNEKFVVYTIVEEVVDLMETQIFQKKLDLSITINTGLELNTDSRLFMQLIQNLINNAIKYTNNGGEIIISAEEKENQLCVSVKDNGIGIPKDKIKTIFNLDSNFNREGTNKEKSTGMGLILSKEYAKLMGAEIFVESEEGKGSKFGVLFPLKRK